METTVIASILSVATAIGGIVLGWSSRSRTIRKDTETVASQGARLRSDVEYIKRGVEQIYVEQSALEQRFGALSERVTRVEESSKQAHKRIDRLEE